LASDDGYIATKISQTAVQLVFGSATCGGTFAPPPSLILLMFVRCGGAFAPPTLRRLWLMSYKKSGFALVRCEIKSSHAGFLVSHAHEFERIKTPYGNVLGGEG